VTWYELVIWGAVGGFVAELVAVTRHRMDTKGKRPRAFRTWWYWSIGVGWVFVGALLAYLTLADASGFGRSVPFQIGLTAPLLIERLLALPPETSAGTSG
jgi:hypothetical protein